mmetsp:Transcript_64293/g.119485  ORF Transcript_64293/g.119485 Transcript_64293/m.119485 type:complete len:189 (+) Transcript_64293:59-625(+)
MANTMLQWSFPTAAGACSCSQRALNPAQQLRGGHARRSAPRVSDCGDSKGAAIASFGCLTLLGSVAVVGSAGRRPWQHLKRSASRRQPVAMKSMSLDFGDEGEVPEWVVKGAQVKVVATDLEFFHVPKMPAPFDPHGLEGRVVRVLDTQTITPNRPIVVQFATDAGRKFLAHFEAQELELLSDGSSDE